MLGKWSSLLIKRDLLLNFKYNNSIIISLFFFFLITLLFPFSLGQNMSILKTIGFNILIVCLLLTSFLSFANIWKNDIYDGSLELYLFSSITLEFFFFFKNMIHWILYESILLCIIPILSIFLQIPLYNVIVIFPLLIFLTIIITQLGSVIEIITVEIKQKNFIITLLIIPILLPSLIFFTQSYITITNDTIIHSIPYYSTMYNLFSIKSTKILIIITLSITASIPWISSIILSLFYK